MVALTGAGATFPYPLYARWIASFAKASGVRVNYLSVGSGEGARLLRERRVDFAATENPAADTAGAPFVYLPMVAGAVAVTYNLPSLARPLRLSGDVIAGIWLGRITRWDDARLRALNPGVALPALPITVVSREEASGTTFVVTTYLASVSRAWAARAGVGGRIRWPVGVVARGTEGVSGTVKQTPGAIGFVELAYSQLNRLPAAAVRNAAGEFVTPSAAATAAALASVIDREVPNDGLLVSLVNPPGVRAYPIVTLSWLSTRSDLAPDKRAALERFVRFVFGAGASDATALNYAPLPEGLATAALAHLAASGPARNGATR